MQQPAAAGAGAAPPTTFVKSELTQHPAPVAGAQDDGGSLQPMAADGKQQPKPKSIAACDRCKKMKRRCSGGSVRAMLCQQRPCCQLHAAASVAFHPHPRASVCSHPCARTALRTLRCEELRVHLLRAAPPWPEERLGGASQEAQRGRLAVADAE